MPSNRNGYFEDWNDGTHVQNRALVKTMLALFLVLLVYCTLTPAASFVWCQRRRALFDKYYGLRPCRLDHFD